MLIKLQQLINKSSLPTEDKDDFIFFVETLDEEDIIQMTETFENSQDTLISFWYTFQQKIIFFQLLDDNKDLSDTAKDDIKNKISQMTDDEFASFLSTLQELKTNPDTQTLMSDLLQQMQNADNNITELTDKFKNNS